MKTLCFVVALLIGAACAGQARPAQSAPPEPTVFELKYRGLSAPDDPLSYQSFTTWSKRDGGEKDPFIRAVKERVGECTPVYYGGLPGSEWGAVELKDQKPVAFYFDVDGDGKLSDGEKFSLTPPSRPGFWCPYVFILPDFLIRTEDKREVPFRVMLMGSPVGGDRISYMWSPCCVLEGEATLAGKPMKLVLYSQGFSGSFTTFGSCSFKLLPAGQAPDVYTARQTLSSLIQYKETFYRVQLSGTHTKDQTVRVAFQKDTSPTGQVTVELKGKQVLKARLTGASIAGGTDPSVHLAVAGTLSTLPVGQYKLNSGTIGYGMESDSEWEMSVADGPGFAAEAGQTNRIELGTPVLSIRALKEEERYSGNAKEQSTFRCGTRIYLAPQIKNAAGAVYAQFAQKEVASGQRTDIRPHMTILGPDGRQIASADIDYG